MYLFLKVIQSAIICLSVHPTFLLYAVVIDLFPSERLLYINKGNNWLEYHHSICPQPHAMPVLSCSCWKHVRIPQSNLNAVDVISSVGNVLEILT